MLRRRPKQRLVRKWPVLPLVCLCPQVLNSNWLNLALRKPFVSQQDNNPLPALLKMLGKLPGVGTRSARRLALHLLQRKETVL
ncbi:MAG: hypothetical protein ACK48E_03995, partial [Holosporales bacterium]